MTVLLLYGRLYSCLYDSTNSFFRGVILDAFHAKIIAMIVEGARIAAALAKKLKSEFAVQPKKRVCFVIFGNDLPSRQFVALKTRLAGELGVEAVLEEYPEDLENTEAVTTIDRIANQNYDGIVVQLPLPAGLHVDEIVNRVPEKMDIDMLGEQAKHAYRSGISHMQPPVARAVEEIFVHYDLAFDTKRVLVVGSGKLVGEPVAAMLSRKNIPFVIIDKDTPEEMKRSEIAQADIIISGAGVPSLIRPDMIKDNIILIDAGTSEQSGKIVGDIDPACGEKASLYTPVPGGVGRLTVVSLFANLLT